MSNPCINRWGLTSLWYHYWYSDSHFHVNLQHDKLFLGVVEFYLNFGTDITPTNFYSPFWYKTSTRPVRVDLKTFYDWTESLDDEGNPLTPRSVRLESAEKFTTRMSILKFESWLVINVYWFQPDKSRKIARPRSFLNPLSSVYTTSKKSNSQLVKVSNIVSRIRPQTSFSLVDYNF